MKLRIYSFIGLLGVASSVFAGDVLIEQVITTAARTHQTTDTANNMRSITAYYIEDDNQGCALVSVRSNEQRRTRHYRACKDAIEERHDVEPASPSDDANFRALVVKTGKSALNAGDTASNFDNYRIHAQRVGWPTATGCGSINITVSFDGMLVDTQQINVCP